MSTIKNNPYVQYVGLGLAGLVTQKDLLDKRTGQPMKKSKFQLIRISAAVCGIELCYAAETAFVSPILLKLGVPTTLMTMVWCLSPVLGFFLVPVMGSLSDRCRAKLGRRRPFIILLSIGIILGLALVPNGESLGAILGDTGTRSNSKGPLLENGVSSSSFRQSAPPTSFPPKMDIHLKSYKPVNRRVAYNSKDVSYNYTSDERSSSGDLTALSDNELKNKYQYHTIQNKSSVAPSMVSDNVDESSNLSIVLSSSRVRGIILTIIGVALLDFSCDACQSPCRAYLLDVSIPEDHSTGLTMFTVMAGAGGAVGYLMGGIDWGSTGFGEAFGGHIRIVFTIVLVAFLVCVVLTLTSFKELPLSELNVCEEKIQRKKKSKHGRKYRKFTNEEDDFSDEEDGHEVENTEDDTRQKHQNQTNAERQSIDQIKKPNENYGSLSQTNATNIDNGNISGKTTNGRFDWSSPKSPANETNTTRYTNDFSETKDKCQSHQNGQITSASGNNSINSNHLPSLSHSEQIIDSSYNNRNSNISKQYNNNSSGLIPQWTNDSSSFSPQVNASWENKRDSRDRLDQYGEQYGDWMMSEGLDLESAIPETVQVSTDVSLKTYLTSIVRMPRCMWILCLCNLLCWMSLVCYSLYFTDFVGECIYRTMYRLLY